MPQANLKGFRQRTVPRLLKSWIGMHPHHMKKITKDGILIIIKLGHVSMRKMHNNGMLDSTNLSLQERKKVEKIEVNPGISEREFCQ